MACLYPSVAFSADALEEHDQRQLEEDHRINGGTTTVGVQLARPLADEAEVNRRLEVAVE
jgi:hypothetical protein